MYPILHTLIKTLNKWLTINKQKNNTSSQFHKTIIIITVNKWYLFVQHVFNPWASIYLYKITFTFGTGDINQNNMKKSPEKLYVWSRSKLTEKKAYTGVTTILQCLLTDKWSFQQMFKTIVYSWNYRMYTKPHNVNCKLPAYLWPTPTITVKNQNFCKSTEY